MQPILRLARSAPQLRRAFSAAEEKRIIEQLDAMSSKINELTPLTTVVSGVGAIVTVFIGYKFVLFVAHNL